MEEVQEEMKRVVVPIVIVQTSKPAFDACMKGLPKETLTHGTDFILVNDTESASEEIIPDEAQFLITGTLNGNEEEARSFAREMKKQNSKLKAAIFSSDKTASEPFDLTIRKNQFDDITQLSVEMKKFLGR